MKKIFIFHATYGSGHKRAAEALYEYMKKRFPEFDIRIFDSLDYVSPIYRMVTQKSYYWSVERAQFIWKAIFSFVNRAKPGGFYYTCQQYIDLFFAGRLRKMLKKEQPDCLISTHFHPGEIACCLKEKGDINSFLGCVITDYMAHSIWFRKNIDAYFAASEFVRDGLVKLGADPGRIFITGISIGEQFRADPEIKDIKPYMKKRNILFIGDYAADRKFKAGMKKELEIYPDTGVFLLSRKIDKYVETEGDCIAKHNIFCSNLRTDVEKFYKAADIVVTKSGGLTTSELTAMGKPMVIYRPIPGQEEANCEELLKRSAGIKIKKRNELVKKSFELAHDSKRLNQMSENSKRLGKANATFDISEKIISRC